MAKQKSLAAMMAALILLTGVTLIFGTPTKVKNIRAGIAKVNITPQESILMTPYNRKAPSNGVHDSLYVKALVLDTGENRLAIIACDLIGYMNEKVFDVARQKFGIPYVLISSTHTHSGPDLRASESYAREVEQKIIEALNQAVDNLFPARIAADYRAFPQLGYMRLVLRKDGRAHAPWYQKDDRYPPHNPDRVPFGPVDPEVGVIRIDDTQGNPRVILMNYACHATVNARNYEISADYPGIAASLVEKEFGDQTISMFVNGGSGNIAPLFRSEKSTPSGDPPTDYSQIEKMGTLLADNVITLAQELRPADTDVASLKVMTDSLTFSGRFNTDLRYDIHFTTVLINDKISIATFPGEPFVWFQMFWKKQAVVPHPFFFGYTYIGGDLPHYVPDIRSAAYGGYGADSDPRLIAVGAGERIMNKQLENLYRLRGIMRDTPGTH